MRRCSADELTLDQNKQDEVRGASQQCRSVVRSREVVYSIWSPSVVFSQRSSKVAIVKEHEVSWIAWWVIA